MNKDRDIDAFTFHIINNIDANMLNTLSPAQLSAIKDAITASKPKKKPFIDFRGIINLFFARYYFVFLMGRDRRMSTQEIEYERRQNVALIGNIIFFIFVSSPFILLTLIILYFLKMGMGIDLIPEHHFGWLFGL